MPNPFFIVNNLHSFLGVGQIVFISFGSDDTIPLAKYVFFSVANADVWYFTQNSLNIPRKYFSPNRHTPTLIPHSKRIWNEPEGWNARQNQSWRTRCETISLQMGFWYMLSRNFPEAGSRKCEAKVATLSYVNKHFSLTNCLYSTAVLEG